MQIHKMFKSISILLTLTLILIVVALISGCPGKLAPTPPATSFISNSEVAEAVASGAFTATYTGGTEARYIPRSPKAVALAKIIQSYLTLVPKAEAALTQGGCALIPAGNSITNAPNSTCGATTNTIGLPLMVLTWAPCNGATPLGTWSGGVNLSLIAPTTTVFTCDNTFAGFQSGDILTRSFFSPSARINNANLDPSNNVPWNPLTQTDLVGANSPVNVLVDTYGASQIPNGSSFTSLPSTYPINGYSGYSFQVPNVGETINFSAPPQRTINVNGIHLKADIGGYITWDFTVSTASASNPGSPLSVSAGNILSGILFVQDNINGITTQTQFNAVSYSSGCGVPTGGNVQTTRVSGAPFTTETLTFTAACGTATLNTTTMYLFHAF